VCMHLALAQRCFHGKDRTGLLVMLVMLLCGITPQVRKRSAIFWVVYILRKLSSFALTGYLL